MLSFAARPQQAATAPSQPGGHVGKTADTLQCTVWLNRDVQRFHVLDAFSLCRGFIGMERRCRQRNVCICLKGVESKHLEAQLEGLRVWNLFKKQCVLKNGCGAGLLHK